MWFASVFIEVWIRRVNLLGLVCPKNGMIWLPLQAEKDFFYALHYYYFKHHNNKKQHSKHCAINEQQSQQTRRTTNNSNCSSKSVKRKKKTFSAFRGKQIIAFLGHTRPKKFTPQIQTSIKTDANHILSF